jgi:uncharacterized protein (DUF885 family)
MTAPSTRLPRQRAVAGLRHFLCLLGVVVFAAHANAVTAVATPADSAAVRTLHALFDRVWEADLVADPLAATYYGDNRFNSRWPDLSPGARLRSHAADVQVLADLAAIPEAQLPAAERLNVALFKRRYQDRIDAWPHKLWSYDLNAREGIQSLNEVAEQMPFASSADYDIWLQRLDTLPQFLDQFIEQLRTAVREGRTQPRGLMERVLPQLAMQTVASPEQSPFFARFTEFPDAVPAAERSRITSRARQVIAERVIPAYRRFDQFFKAEYLPACRTSVGIWDTPGGDAFYANRIRFHTTTDLTPDDIHALGLKEVERIRLEMETVMKQVGFTGTRQQFFEKLRTDPQFYYRTPDELFRAYVVTAKQIEPELPALFGKLYRTPFGVRPIPMTSAPNTTTAYYSGPSLDGRRAGYYYVNLYRPEVRPKYEIEVLTVHESVPGHHLQIALAQELGDMPTFRRFGDFTAFIEGWGLYSERLGYELGLYKDPYSRFGQLTYDMWRAVRLVVDTGIHARHWSRQQAIDYFKDNAPKTETDIVNEIDRYIGWPGQALAYKIGQLKILSLRAMAERELGTRFDVRRFHDAVLGSGAVPLDVLEVQMRDWVKTQQNLPAVRPEQNAD